MQIKATSGILLAFLGFVALLSPFSIAQAAEIEALHFIEHSSATNIQEGDTISRDDLNHVADSWTFDFTWPHSVGRTKGVVAVFRGSFGNVEGGVPIEGINYGLDNRSFGFTDDGHDHQFFNLNLPPLGLLETTSHTYTALVAEKGSADITNQQIVNWFASGGAEGIAPVDYDTITFFYDATFTPDDLDSIDHVLHGRKAIFDGDVVYQDQFHQHDSASDYFWTFDFDWPNDVNNKRGLFAVFHGTFGDLEGGKGERGVNYGYDEHFWIGESPFRRARPIEEMPGLAASTTPEGTYTLMVAERDPKYTDPGLGFTTEDQIEWFATGGAEGIPPRQYSLLEFDYFQEPQLDPLLLQYEPILYLHPSERFQPMNVEAFIGASTLWDENGLLADQILKAESVSDPVTVADIAVPEESADWYLGFSGGSSAKTIDVAVALDKYSNLVSEHQAVPTYYAYKTEDSYTDDAGKLHEFIVLQYWYFYALNDWREHGGLNNHEGDWESVFVFLDKDTQEPQYAAYSAHHNEGEKNQILGKYDSVRRDWNSGEVSKEDDQAISFVALGSHANYPNNGNSGVHTTTAGNDLTSQLGTHLESDHWLNIEQVTSNEPAWMLYEGQWGVEIIDILESSSGPRGPNFIDVSGIVRFHNPIEWAGIDKIAEKTISEPTDTLDFPSQSTTMFFSRDLEEGTEVNVDLHDENISFGSNIDSTTLLPHFWDIESNLENETFEVEVELGYDPEEVEMLGTDENHLGIFFYDEIENVWERVGSVVDSAANTISFVTTHFSRYAIGVVELTPNEEIQLFREYIENADLQRGVHNHMIAQINVVEKLISRGQSHEAHIVLMNIERYIQTKENKKISETEASDLLVLLENLKLSILI